MPNTALTWFKIPVSITTFWFMLFKMSFLESVTKHQSFEEKKSTYVLQKL